MIGLFSTRGTVGRAYFLLCMLLYVISVPLGFIICLLIRVWTRPIVFIWSESAARFVAEQIVWIATGWRTILVVIAFYLIGDRIFSCAYIKRARAIGVEIAGAWLVPLFFLGFERGANMRQMLLTRGGRKSETT